MNLRIISAESDNITDRIGWISYEKYFFFTVSVCLHFAGRLKSRKWKQPPAPGTCTVIKKTWSNLLDVKCRQINDKILNENVDKQSQNTLVLVNILAWQLQFEQNPKTKYQENSVNLGTDGKKHGNCLNFWPTEKF